MDTQVPGKDVPQEVARELLIAISESVPDKILDPEQSPDSLNGVEKGKEDGDNAEKYRSELISISYMSPDVKSSP